MEILASSDPALRRWAVRLLADQPIDDETVIRSLVRLAEEESDGFVLMYLASALQRLPLDQRWALAGQIAETPLAAEDGRLQRMIWYGIEPAVASEPQQAGDWLQLALPPDLMRWTARRLAVLQVEDPNALAPAIGTTLGKLNAVQSDAVLDGLATGLKGASQLSPPAEWQAWTETLPENSDSRITIGVGRIGVSVWRRSW